MYTVYNSPSDSEQLLQTIKKCILDLNQVSNQLLNNNKNLTTPFEYLHEWGQGSSLTNHTYSNNNYKNASSLRFSSYYSSRIDFNDDANDNSDELFEQAANISANLSFASSTEDFFYYQNCVVEILLKLFARTIYEKFALTKYLIEDLMPTNSDLIKMFVSYSNKLNGMHQTLQFLYDHLIVNSIDNEQLWIL